MIPQCHEHFSAIKMTDILKCSRFLKNIWLDTTFSEYNIGCTVRYKPCELFLYRFFRQSIQDTVLILYFQLRIVFCHICLALHLHQLAQTVLNTCRVCTKLYMKTMHDFWLILSFQFPYCVHCGTEPIITATGICKVKIVGQCCLWIIHIYNTNAFTSCL